MIILIENSDEAKSLVKELATQLKKEFKVGFTGDYALEDESKITKNTVLEIVLKTNKGYEKLNGDVEVIRNISDFMKQHYINKFRVIWYDLIEQEQKELLEKEFEGGSPETGVLFFDQVLDNLVWVSEDDEESDEEPETEADETEDAEMFIEE